VAQQARGAALATVSSEPDLLLRVHSVDLVREVQDVFALERELERTHPTVELPPVLQHDDNFALAARTVSGAHSADA
jgi:hypothetical protein